MANGCYRCFLTATTDTDTAINAFIATADAAGSYSYVGDGVSGIYAGLGQLEANSTMSSYIPTTTAAVTRAADNIQFAAPSGTLPTTNGSIYFEGRAYSWGADAVDHRMVAHKDSGEWGLARFSGGGVALHDGTGYISSGSNYTNGGPLKFGVSYTGVTATFSLNGATATTGTFDGALSPGASYGIGTAVGGGSNWDGYIQDVRFYNYALNAAQLQTVTTT